VNQRLLIIFAALLLVIGCAGLLLLPDESANGTATSAAEAKKEIIYYTSNENLIPGSQLNENNYTRKTKSVPVSAEEQSESLPEDLHRYYVVRDISAGEKITRADLSQTNPRPLVAKEGHYLYNMIINSYHLSPALSLRAGDRVDIYIKYFNREGHDGKKRITSQQTLLMQPDEKFTHGGARMTMLNFTRIAKNKIVLAPVRVMEEVKGKQGNKDEEKKTFFIVLEVDETVLKRLYRLQEQGEFILFPAGAASKKSASDTRKKTDGVEKGTLK
jgi:hypothetical protein